MNYVTGRAIRALREKKKLTQRQLAEQIGVSDKAVSKWETEKGFPDIGILEDLAGALGVSAAELLTGEFRENDNRAANMKKTQFYVCPVCGNLIASAGRCAVSCCGITLPEQEPEACGADHSIQVSSVDGEYFVTVPHPMEKGHFISFFAYLTGNGAEIVKLYPEQDASARFRKKGHGALCAFCSRHGMFQVPV